MRGGEKLFDIRVLRHVQQGRPDLCPDILDFLRPITVTYSSTEKDIINKSQIKQKEVYTNQSIFKKSLQSFEFNKWEIVFYKIVGTSIRILPMAKFFKPLTLLTNLKVSW